ncbi:MAG: hypothetical protein ACR2IK_05430, partial [Chloroflexota bacterium]
MTRTTTVASPEMRGLARRSSPSLEHVVLAGLGLLIAFLVLAPAGMLLYSSVLTAPPGDHGAVLTLGNYAAALSQRRNLDLIGTTLVYALGTTLFAVVLGT